MSKYNVGDVVKLRDNLEAGKYGKDSFVKEMGIMKNNPIKIIDVNESDYLTNYGWYITDEMIEGLWEECKPKLKLIDVLNMIAKGELKEGTKVKHNQKEYEFKVLGEEDEKDLVDEDNNTLFDCYYITILSNEVELIEPPCEHEWLDWETHRMGEGRIRRYRRCNKCGLEEETDKCIPDEGKTSEPTKIEELGFNKLLTIEGNVISIINKLNEVINKVNAQTEVILAHRKDIDEIKEQLDY